MESYSPPISKRQVISNGLSLERFAHPENPSTVKAKYGISTAKAVIMSASFSKYKDYDKFLRIAKIVTSQYDDVTFIGIGGYNPDDLFYQQVIDQAKGFPRILFPGRVADVESLVNACTIGCLFSTYGEGLSNSILEYMALGKPVIATDLGGNKELVMHNFNGYLVKNQTDEEVAKLFLSLLNNDELTFEMGERGKQLILSRSHWLRWAKHLTIFTKDYLHALKWKARIKKTNSMNVLFLSRSNCSSPHAFVEEQAEALRKAYELQITHQIIPKGGLSGYISAIRSLMNNIREKQIDIIHVHYGLWGIVGIINKFLFHKNIKVLITYHGSDLFKRNERPISLMASRFADYNILVSEKMKHWFTKKYSVIPCGIDTNIPQVDRLQTRKLKGWDTEDLVILFASSFDRPVKDPEFAFKVITLLKRKCRRRVHFIELKGYSRSELTALMQSADALLMCSKSEGSPQVIKEAILNRLPVVSNDIGDVARICQDIDQCYIVPKNISKYVNVLRKLSRTKARIANHYSVVNEYDNSRIADQIHAIYLNILKTASWQPG